MKMGFSVEDSSSEHLGSIVFSQLVIIRYCLPYIALNQGKRGVLAVGEEASPSLLAIRKLPYPPRPTSIDAFLIPFLIPFPVFPTHKQTRPPLLPRQIHIPLLLPLTLVIPRSIPPIPLLQNNPALPVPELARKIRNDSILALRVRRSA